MKRTVLFFALTAAISFCSPVFPGTGDFIEFDLDHDGTLNIAEAKSAFPAMLVIDVNNDGYLNRPEAEFALDALELPPETSCQDDRVRAYEFRIIRQKLQENEELLKEQLSVMRKP